MDVREVEKAWGMLWQVDDVSLQQNIERGISLCNAKYDGIPIVGVALRAELIEDGVFKVPLMRNGSVPPGHMVFVFDKNGTGEDGAN